MDTMESFGGPFLLKDRAYEILKRQIIIGNFKPGDKLNISDLANRMNISYAPVREALNLLCKEGLVELPPHKQAVVAKNNEKDLQISIELRKMLEPYAAEQSANIVPDEKLEELRQKLLYVWNNPTDDQSYMDSDLQLHEMFHIYLGSKILSDILETLKMSSLRYRYLNESASENKAQIIRKITEEHLAVIDAFKQRDPEKIRVAVSNHIQGYSTRCEDTYQKQGD